MRPEHLIDLIHARGSAADDLPPIVLVVDDHNDTLELYDLSLSARGYWVARAGNGLEALECAQDLQPDAIVTDVGLGGDMDGTDLIRELHADQKLARVPVLVVTGREPRELPSFAGLLISGILLKPVAPETLASHVAQLLQLVGPQADATPASAAAAAERIAPSEATPASAATASRSNANKRHRLCPHCGTRLTWLETGRLRHVAYDYYAPCANGCGLSCFNRATQNFELLIAAKGEN